MLLTALPDALDSIVSGDLTVEQSSIVVTQLRQVVDLESRSALWRRLLERLRRPEGAVLPPARLQELLKGWIVRCDPADAERRRRAAEDERRVEYRRRDDGLVDVLLLGVAPPLAQTVLHRIRAQAAPVGLFDDRTADQRRLDAAVDLLLGREGSCGSTCDCWPRTPVPCGADVKLLVQALREALLDLATSPPGRLHPRHPDDHPPAPPADSAQRLRMAVRTHRQTPHPVPPLPAPTHPTPPARTSSPDFCANSSSPVRRCASSPPAALGRRAATSSTTGPTPTGRPAPATSGRCAVVTTG